MRRYERASTLLTQTALWRTGQTAGDVAAVTAMLDRLLHHGHVLKCGRAVGAPRQPSAPQERINEFPALGSPS